MPSQSAAAPAAPRPALGAVSFAGADLSALTPASPLLPATLVAAGAGRRRRAA